MTLGLSRVTCRLELHLKEVQTYLEEHPTPLVLSGQHMSGSRTAHLRKDTKVMHMVNSIQTKYATYTKVLAKFA